MDVLNDIKSIYQGENAIRNHQIFAVVLIIYLILNNVFEHRDMFWLALILEFVFETIIGGYLFSYLSNVLHKNQTGMPCIKELNIQKALVTVGLSILWGIYILIPLLFIAGIIYALTTRVFAQFSSLVIVFFAMLGLLLCIPAIFMKHLIIIAYSDNVPAKTLLSPLLMRKLFASYVPVLYIYTKYFFFALLACMMLVGILVTLIFLKVNYTVVACISLCVGIPFAYVLFIIYTFSFPKSLTEVYVNEVRPWLAPVKTECDS